MKYYGKNAKIELVSSSDNTAEPIAIMIGVFDNLSPINWGKLVSSGSSIASSISLGESKSMPTYTVTDIFGVGWPLEYQFTGGKEHGDKYHCEEDL